MFHCCRHGKKKKKKKKKERKKERKKVFTFERRLAKVIGETLTSMLRLSFRKVKNCLRIAACKMASLNPIEKFHLLTRGICFISSIKCTH
jgi:hypothetical protein